MCYISVNVLDSDNFLCQLDQLSEFSKHFEASFTFLIAAAVSARNSALLIFPSCRSILANIIFGPFLHSFSNEEKSFKTQPVLEHPSFQNSWSWVENTKDPQALVGKINNLLEKETRRCSSSPLGDGEVERGKQPTLAGHHEVVLGVEGLAKGDQKGLKALDAFTFSLKINFKLCHHGTDLGSLHPGFTVRKRAGPGAGRVKGISRQENALIASFRAIWAEQGRGKSAHLCWISTPGAGAVKEPVLANLAAPGCSPKHWGHVVDRHLLPLKDVHLGPQDHASVRQHLVAGIGSAGVGKEGESGEEAKTLAVPWNSYRHRVGLEQPNGMEHILL